MYPIISRHKGGLVSCMHPCRHFLLAAHSCTRGGRCRHVSQHNTARGPCATPNSDKKAKINGTRSNAQLSRVVSTTWQPKIRLRDQPLDPRWATSRSERPLTKSTTPGDRRHYNPQKPRTPFRIRGDTTSRSSIFTVNETLAALGDPCLPQFLGEKILSTQCRLLSARWLPHFTRTQRSTSSSPSVINSMSSTIVPWLTSFGLGGLVGAGWEVQQRALKRDTSLYCCSRTMSKAM